MSSSAYVGDEPPPPYTETSNDSVPLGQRQQPAQPSTNPPPSSQPAQLSTFTICVKPNTRRTELPYPSEWAPRHNLSPQDWEAFVGRLIPESAPEDTKCLSYERKREIGAAIREWNETYFEPRGIRIIFEEQSPSQQAQSQSGASSSSALPHPDPSAGYQSQQPSQPFPDQLPPRPAGQPSRRHMSTRQKLTNKLKQVAQENDITYSGQHIRFGQMFTVDPDKIQIGRLNFDDRGMQYGGRPIGPQFPPGYMDRIMTPGNRLGRMHSQGYHGADNASGYSQGAPQPQGYYGHSGYGPSNGIPHTGSWPASSSSQQSGAYGPQYQGQSSQANGFRPPQGPPPAQTRATFG